MPIKTSSFKLTRKDLFLFSIRKFYGTAAIVAVILFFNLWPSLRLGFQPLVLVFPSMLLIFLGWVFFFVWRQTGDKENKNFYVSRHYELNEQSLDSYVEGGSQGSMRFENLIGIQTWKDYFLVYVSKVIFHMIPLSAFASAEEAARFKQVLLEKGVPVKKDRSIFRILLFWALLLILFLALIHW
jgi:hypothetical protein